MNPNGWHHAKHMTTQRVVRALVPWVLVILFFVILGLAH